jgi:glycosyltransferase involved in cell wall biosynthesis
MCSRWPLTRQLGASKVLIEVADALRELPGGVTCDLVGPGEIGVDAGAGWKVYQGALRVYLRRQAERYDVVDFDHEGLPFARGDFAPKTLMVARSVLLVHHLGTIRMPQPRGLRAMAGRLLRGRARRAERQRRIADATATIRGAADLINVSNDHDKAELVQRHGVPAEKIAVIPFGMSAARQAEFDAQTSAPAPARPIVGFVGTFDYRKGATDFPRIVRDVVAAMPQTRFRLLGTKGLFTTAQQVLEFFPAGLRRHVEIRPEFAIGELPGLLSDCSVGVFPSYIEGFGFGVLEMLAAHVPVIAYDAPGPPMMLPPEYLVEPGDGAAMARKVIDLLRDPARLATARAWAKERSRAFCWRSIAERTVAVYGDPAAAVDFSK